MPRKPSRSPRSPSQRGRFSVKRKSATVLRLLRGEDLDTLYRELGVMPSTLSKWRDLFLSAGQSGLKTRLASPFVGEGPPPCKGRRVIRCRESSLQPTYHPYDYSALPEGPSTQVPRRGGPRRGVGR